MATPKEIEEKFWKALKSDRTFMLGLDGAECGHTRPMTAQVENDRSPIWIFTDIDNPLAAAAAGARATASFVDKGHELYASLKGTLTVDKDRAVIDRLWNTWIEAWFPGGKDDPKLTLLRLDATEAEVWLNENNLLSMARMLLGTPPQQDYSGKNATIDLA